MAVGLALQYFLVMSSFLDFDMVTYNPLYVQRIFVFTGDYTRVIESQTDFRF